ncbi:MAG: TylF/MycF/NovP-related O-methyltransferase [Bacteroidales bacterium]|jgi:O-methyltransferase|nr:TylF/MycF/NovP-related O-methyltransferase [Bacteroidales bacterium]
MNLEDIFKLIELILLIGVAILLFRFFVSNFTSKVQKPKAWQQAVKAGEVPAALLKAEKKYNDRIRFYNIWMQIRRIHKENIEGDFAELGVYKGETAKVIRLCAPQRKLHLFDTFDGFPAGDLEYETGKASGYTSRHFADTSEEKVQGLLGFSKNIVFHKGYFPGTTAGMEETRFAFVSMDADLARPTKAGLEFFYPRLQKGGCILIHDYNTDWPELLKTVDDFVKNIAEPLIPVPDADGTVMIIRQ